MSKVNEWTVVRGLHKAVYRGTYAEDFARNYWTAFGGTIISPKGERKEDPHADKRDEHGRLPIQVGVRND